jgi:HrpA-like RNA helicase
MSDVQSVQNGLTDEDINSILKGIKHSPISVVISSTGSGKTTKLVKEIHERGKCQIFVVEPTIPAAENPYNYMGEILGKDLVGMAAEGNIKYKVDTPIVYCTSGHIRRKLIGLLKSGVTDLRFCDVLMIDEAHSGTLDNDVIMSIWKWAFEKGYTVPKLLLASATLTIEQTPFAGDTNIFIYNIITKSYPVTIKYYRTSYAPESRLLLKETATLILDEHRNVALPEERGDKWLAFCSGMNEVNDLIKHLNAGLTPEEKVNTEVIAIYGQISTEERRKVFQTAPIGKRIIVVGTNVAETSITIDGLSIIFDTMTEKFGETSASGGFRLVQHRISKSSAKQRAGRVGRQFPGTVFRMITEQDFDFLPEQRQTELNRVPLHTMAIELLDAGIDPIELFNKRIDPHKLLLSVGLLKRLGMVTETGHVTKAGEFAAAFPLSVRSSGVIWEWIKTGKPLFPCVVTMALIDCFNPSYFYYPRVEEPDEVKRQAAMNKHYSKYFAKFAAPTDIGVLLNIWADVSTFVNKLDPTSKKFFRWCSENSMNQRKMRELFNIIRQVCNALYRLGREIKLGKFNNDNVINVLSPILAKVYADLTFDYVGSEKYFDPFNRDYYRLDKRNSLAGAPRPNSEKVITLISIEVQNRKISLPVRTITLFHPIGNSVSKDFVRDGPSIITGSKPVAAFGSKVEIVIPNMPGRPTSPTRRPPTISGIQPGHPTAPIVVTIPGLSRSLPKFVSEITSKPIPGGIPLPTNWTPQRPMVVPPGTPLPTSIAPITSIKPKVIAPASLHTKIATGLVPKGIVLQIPIRPTIPRPMSPRLFVPLNVRSSPSKPNSPTRTIIPFVVKELSPRASVHTVITPGSPKSIMSNQLRPVHNELATSSHNEIIIPASPILAPIAPTIKYVGSPRQNDTNMTVVDINKT